jgi:hypothetical protein
MRNVFLVVVVVLMVGLIAPASAAVITIDAQSNLWVAGQATAPGGGETPPYISFTAGDVLWVQFDNVAGTASCGGPTSALCTATSGDGQIYIGGGTNIAAPGNSGLSGFDYIGRVMFLIGVFLTDSPPSGANPADFLIYTDALANGPSFSPALGQVFFIGDGQGSSGVQLFVPPSGATRLYLGFADGVPLFGSANTPASPGAYADNSGQMVGTYDLVTPIPEPGSVFLLGLGVAALALLRRRRA